MEPRPENYARDLRDRAAMVNATGGFPSDRPNLYSRAADEIERLQLLVHMLANQDANGVAYMICEYPHLAEVVEKGPLSS